MYTTEFKGSFPYGFIFNQYNANGRPTNGDNSYITWFSSCDKYMTAKASVVIPLDRPNTSNGWIDGGTSRRIAKAFRCPSVPADFRQQCTYADHPVIMPHYPDEIAGTTSTMPRLLAPLTLSQVYPHNALFWDTYANHDMSENAPWGPWWSKTGGGANIASSMIDDRKPAASTEDALLAHPRIPERRFRGPTGDRFAGNADQTLDPNGPIAMANDQWLADLGFPYSINTDYASGTEWNSGNARFRHNGNSASTWRSSMAPSAPSS
jgi:hypothetical protein